MFGKKLYSRWEIYINYMKVLESFYKIIKNKDIQRCENELAYRVHEEKSDIRNKIAVTIDDDIVEKRTKLKVVSILDKFSYECFKYECDLIPLKINNWKNTLYNEKPGLLLVESAVLGNDGQWRNKIINLKRSKDRTLISLVKECRKQNIPTIFWNKEDPLFFEHFSEAAKLFDHVFTTDKGCVGKYKSVLGHNNIHVLPFAAQPKLHNPIDKDRIRLGKVAFAGTWYNLYHKRRRDMEIILKPALKYDVHIYDRMYHLKTKDNLYSYPSIYKPYIKGAIDYAEISSTYKKYNIQLNANLIGNSPTMFSRRVFELLACGVNVISSYALGIDKMFPDIIKLCRTEKDTEKYLKILLEDKDLRDRLSLLGQREIFNKHTYRHRFETILEKSKVSYKKGEIPGVSIISCIGDPNIIEKVWDNFQRQNYKNKELIIVLKNNSINIEKLKEKKSFNKNIRVFYVGEEKSFGECLNFAIDQASYKYVSKFDENNYYGSEFIGDLMNAFKYTDAHIVGKGTYYEYIEKRKNLKVRFPNKENQYVNSLCQSAFIMQKNICRQIKFRNEGDRIVDIFFKDCIQARIKLYSTDRFNYVNIKKSYKEDDDKLLKEGDVITNTRNYKGHITV